jgi:hypothetical protein
MIYLVGINLHPWQHQAQLSHTGVMHLPAWGAKGQLLTCLQALSPSWQDRLAAAAACVAM